MKQDINLLMSSSRQSGPRPTAVQLGVAWLLLILVAVAFGAWHDFERDSLQRTVRTLNATIDDLMVNLEERSSYLAQRNADPSLVEELKRREREASDKSRVLELLSGKSVGNIDGFSAQLAAIGRRHPHGLWLDRILIGNGGRQYFLRGHTLDADLVPKFLGELQHEPSLAGTGFATFTLSDDDTADGPLRFAMATECEPAEPAQAATGCLSIDEAATP